jgi:hypothetical protein
MWCRANMKRMMTIAMSIAVAAVLLLLLLSSLGDSDLPPYDPPFAGERAGWIISGVISWPLFLTALLLGRNPPFAFSLPLIILGGLFWSALIEGAIQIRSKWMSMPREIHANGAGSNDGGTE